MPRGRPRKWSPEQTQQIVGLAKTGMAYKKIAEIMNDKDHAIKNALKRYGVYVTREDVGKLEWQPIETSPKDGTIVIGYDPKAKKWNVKFMAYHKTKTGGFWRNEVVTGTFDPTHWMPLPEPPK